MSSDVYNFSSGPATLPKEVLQKVASSLLDYNLSRLSVLEISHRSPEYEKINSCAQSILLELLGLSAHDYDVLFLACGASYQFALVPMNFLSANKSADYVDTGVWSEKAIEEAKRFAKVNIVGTSRADNFRSIPDFKISPTASYIHITSNNTIEGTEFEEYPQTGEVPLVVDASSDILSKKFIFERASFIYAGAQKNLGPAGLTVIIAKKDFLKKSNSNTATILNYQTHAKNNSLYNTPPVFAVYTFLEMMNWIKATGGLEHFYKESQLKSKMIYEVLLKRKEVFELVVKEPRFRSVTNITFRLNKPENENSFIKKAEQEGLLGLKGHRLVGGMRASIYNAMPFEGVKKLANFLENF